MSASWLAGEFGIQVNLHVVPVAGLTREMTFHDTGLPWVPPSPNMPSVESALHYPGTCLFEGTNISVGRGTDRAFQILGAPWLDAPALVAALEAYELAGVRFEPVRFTPRGPGDGKFHEEEIGGVALTALDPSYDPTVTALALLLETRKMSGDHWAWRVSHFDRLAGTDRLRLGVEGGEGIQGLQEGWEAALAAFRERRAPYLIYP